MRLWSTTALSIALGAVSLGLVMPSTAFAAKKDEKAAANAAPKLNLSKEFMPGAQALQKLVQGADWPNAKTKAAEIEPTATKPDDKYFLGQMVLNVGLSLKEPPLQRKGLEMMLASGFTPAADVARYNFFVGQFAFSGKDYPAARASLDTAIKAGYEDQASALVLLANSYFLEAQGQVSGNAFTPAGQTLIRQGLPYLKQAVEAQQAKGTPADATWYSTGFRMAFASKDPSLPEWTKLALSNNGSAENWRLALRGLQDENHAITRDESLDLLRLMASTKSLQNAYSYSEYAETAWKAGLPGEVKSVIDTGRQSGEINATQLGDLYQLANGSVAKDKASLPASEKSAAAAATGKPASSTGNAYLSYGDYAKAAELYRLALQKGGVDANEVNTRLGIALARSGDKAGALEAFGKVSGTGVRKQIADLWVVWLNKQTA